MFWTAIIGATSASAWDSPTPECSAITLESVTNSECDANQSYPDGRPPDLASVSFTENKLRLTFEWTDALSAEFTSGKAFEVGAAFFGGDRFVIPANMPDHDPRLNCSFSENFPCGYYDVFNHDPGTFDEFVSALANECEEWDNDLHNVFTAPGALAEALVIHQGVLGAADSAPQFSIGSSCAERLIAGETEVPSLPGTALLLLNSMIERLLKRNHYFSPAHPKDRRTSTRI